MQRKAAPRNGAAFVRLLLRSTKTGHLIEAVAGNSLSLTAWDCQAVDHHAAPLVFSAARKSPTRQAVMRSPSVTGSGTVPLRTPRQIVDAEQKPYSARTTGRRTCAISGSSSKPASTDASRAASSAGEAGVADASLRGRPRRGVDVDCVATVNLDVDLIDHRGTVGIKKPPELSPGGVGSQAALGRVAGERAGVPGQLMESSSHGFLWCQAQF